MECGWMGVAVLPLRAFFVWNVKLTVHHAEKVVEWKLMVGDFSPPTTSFLN